MPVPRLITIEKSGGSFGFFLQDINDVHLLNQITKGGAAAMAGVNENDRVVEINGQNVESLTHDKVVGMIRSSGDRVCFLVVW